MKTLLFFTLYRVRVGKNLLFECDMGFENDTLCHIIFEIMDF